MDHRTRYLNVLRGQPVDRLPFLEAASLSWVIKHREDWREAVGNNFDIHSRFGFDNGPGSPVYEAVPVDWYAVPRYEERELPSKDGYRRNIDGRFGCSLKIIPADPPNIPFRKRIFEDHVIKKPSDWREVRKHFRPTTEGRFPEDWEVWCEHSRKAKHPVVLYIGDLGSHLNNLMGEERFYLSFFEMPDLVREMITELSELSQVCIEKALKEARVDMIFVGSDCSPVIGPNVIRDFFLEAESHLVDLAKSCGIDLICISGRGNILPVIEPYREIGANGVDYVMESGDSDYLDAIVSQYGDSLFIIGAIDGRVLLEDFDAIEREVDRKIGLARKHRIVPTLHVTHILPDVPYVNYAHYAEYLRAAIFGN